MDLSTHLQYVLHVICILDTLHVHHGNKAAATLWHVMICQHLLISHQRHGSLLKGDQYLCHALWAGIDTAYVCRGNWNCKPFFFHHIFQMKIDVRETFESESHFKSSNSESWLLCLSKFIRDDFQYSTWPHVEEDVRLCPIILLWVHHANPSLRLWISNIWYVIDHPLSLLQVIGTIMRWTNDFFPF